MRWFVGMVGLCAFTSTAWATPGTMTHSGRLVDTTGVPINGAQQLTLTLYSGPEAGATALWTDTIPVTVQDGYYTVVMGDDPAFAPTVWDGSVRWLGINVGQIPLGDRQPIYSVPYSERAAVAERALTADTAASADTALTADSATTAVNATGDITPTSVTTSGAVRADAVGVGVTPSLGHIHVQSAQGPGLFVRTTDSDDGSPSVVIDGPPGTERAIAFHTNGTQEWWFGRDNVGDVASGIGLWREGEGFALVVDDSRAVGVGGVTAPQAALDVNGGIRTTNLGRLQVVSGWAGSVQTVPFTPAYVMGHVGETYIYTSFAPDLADDASCASAGTGGLPRAFFDGEDSTAMGQYSYTLYNYGGAAAILGTWHGWRSYLRSPTTNQVAEGVGEVHFTLRYTGDRWRVEHMAGQVGGVSWSCR